MRLDAVLWTLRDPLLRSSWGRWGSIGALTLLGIAWITTLATPSTGTPTLVVHYTTTFGIDALGTWSDLLRLPLLGSLLLVVNVGIARWVAVAGDRMAGEGSLSRLPVASSMLIAATVLLEGGVALAALLLFRMNVA